MLFDLLLKGVPKWNQHFYRLASPLLLDEDEDQIVQPPKSYKALSREPLVMPTSMMERWYMSTSTSLARVHQDLTNDTLRELSKIYNQNSWYWR